jgi:hypothetical protein
MQSQGIAPDEDRIRTAVTELQGLMPHHDPEVCCEVRVGEDPEGM